MNDSQFREIWEEAANGQSLCALINGDVGWMMYMRANGDPGFSSRNPAFSGPEDEMIEYRLNNGQIDKYPASWAYPVEVVESALAFFRERNAPPLFIHWHNDSGDGIVLEQRNA